MQKPCNRCGKEIEEDAMQCPHCMAAQDAQNGQTPDAPPTEETLLPDTEVSIPEELPPEVLMPNDLRPEADAIIRHELPPEADATLLSLPDKPQTDWETTYANTAADHTVTADRKGWLRRLTAQKYGKLKLSLIAVGLVLVLLFTGGILAAVLWPEKPLFDFNFDKVLQGNLDELIASGDAVPYAHFYAEDAELGIPAFRALIPKDWTVNGKIIWNYAGAQFPALYTLSAFAPEKAATLYTVSQMQFVDGNDPDGVFAESKQNLLQPLQTPVSFVESFLPDAFGMQLPFLSDSVNLDPDGAMQKRYTALLEPLLQSYRAQGIKLSEAKLQATEISGSVLLNGVSCDVNVRILLCSYCLTKGDTAITVWQVIGLQACAAPVGTLMQYLPQMRVIAANQTINQSWLAARDRAREKSVALLRDGAVSDSNSLDTQSTVLLEAAKQELDKTARYGKDAAELQYNLFTDLLDELKSYIHEKEAPFYMSKDFSKVWLGDQGGEDDVILGVKPAEFQPKSVLQWKELHALSEQ